MNGPPDMLARWGAMILAIALALTAQAETDRWVVIARNGDLVSSLDSATIRVEGDRRIVWHRVDFGRPLDRGVTTVLFQVEVHCTRRTVAPLSAETRTASGAIVQSYNDDAPSPRAAEPDTLDERLVELVCQVSN